MSRPGSDGTSSFFFFILNICLHLFKAGRLCQTSFPHNSGTIAICSEQTHVSALTETRQKIKQIWLHVVLKCYIKCLLNSLDSL